MVREGEVKSLDDHRLWDNGDINIIVSGIDEVLLRKGVSRCHLSARCDLPTDIEILQKQRPMSLSVG